MQNWVAKCFVRLTCRHVEKEYYIYIYIFTYMHMHPLSVHMYVCVFAARAPGARHRSTLVHGARVKLRIPILPRETNLGPRLRSTKCDEVRRSLDRHLH